MTTLSDEIRATNGHQRGRAVPALPSITLSSGYSVQLRRQPADVMPKVKVAVERELAESKPTIPTQRMETAPGQFHEVENANDPEYLRALAAWDRQVGMRSSEKLLTLMTRMALVFEIDVDLLADLRKTYTDLGIELPDDDRAAFLSYVIAPTMEDQARLFDEVYGKALPTEAQVALHRAMFPGDLERNADRSAARPDG